MKESLEKKKHRAAEIIAILKKQYPNANCALKHVNAYELLVATILSAQCTDVRVNMVTPVLFKKYPTPESLAQASQNDVEKIIRTTGFFRSKAKSIRESAADIIAKHGGQVPQTMEQLVALRGVGRKTANVVLGNAFGKSIGIVVDTHVKRIAHRLALTVYKEPVKVEKDLMKIVPQQDWTIFSHLLIHHGRQICMARKPRCESCPILKNCPFGTDAIRI
ncbi:MAG: endonuclease III [Phycisphaerales bacterium]|nr:endonuclease III [Phycisphaerales bacterium]